MNTAPATPFPHGLSGPACSPPPSKRANTNSTIVDLISLEPIVVDGDSISSEDLGQMLLDVFPATSDSYFVEGEYVQTSPASVRSRTPPRGADGIPPAYISLDSAELLAVPARIPDDSAQISDLYGLLFANATNNTTLLKHIDCVNTNVANLSNSVEQLRTVTQEAQSSASFAVSAVQALSKSVDVKFADFEKKLQSFSTAPPSDPRPSARLRSSSAPGRNFPASGMDYIEALVLGWPSFTRASLASVWLKELLDKATASNPNITPLLRPINGNFCKVGVFRFDSFEDRRDFISLVKDKAWLDFQNKCVLSSLYIKACVPKDVAQDTDILRASVYQCHQILQKSPDAKEQILACYKTRTLTLFDTPICYYIDTENNRLEKREGGEFCIDRSIISKLAVENSFDFDGDLLVQFFTKKFTGRTVTDK